MFQSKEKRVGIAFSLFLLIGFYYYSNNHNNKNKDAVNESLDGSKKTKEDDSKETKEGDWRFFNGDLNTYYNELEMDIKRNPKQIGDYAVHRWMGPKRSKVEQNQIMHDAAHRHLPLDAQTTAASSKLQVLDAGCGLGSGLMWMEQNEPEWDLTGHTISKGQIQFIDEKIPEHKFRVNLRSYDDLDDNRNYNFIYSIEAFIHSPSAEATLKEWSDHLSEGGIIAIIDDFVETGVDPKGDEQFDNFAKSWLANVLLTTTELGELAEKFGLHVIEDRDLKTEYRINELNYRNKKPDVEVETNKHAVNGKKTHQGWMGAQWRRHLMIEGKLTYHLLVLRKGEKQNSV